MQWNDPKTCLALNITPIGDVGEFCWYIDNGSKSSFTILKTQFSEINLKNVVIRFRRKHVRA